jgi:stage IV sporulation protein FB
MMLSAPQPTPFDLRFRLFGTHVSVHPLFWVMALVFGWNVHSNISLTGEQPGVIALPVWVLCVFVSILLHEFGHVWMGRYFYAEPHIVLHAMGGLAIGASALYEWWKRLLVYIAGPAIQLALWGALYGLARAGLLGWAVESPVVLFFLEQMMWINLVWPLFNLLPIWPLDGGQITREVCVRASELRGLEVSLWISLVTAATLAINAILGTRGAMAQGMRPFLPWYAPTGTFSILFFAVFAFESWQGLQEVRARKSFIEDHREW